jgi:hypothetical protein
MEGILNLLRKLGYSENEIKTVLNKVPTSQEGLMGTNVATGIFSKPKEGKLAKDFLVSDKIGNPFEIDYYKGRSKEDILTSASAQLKMIDDELANLTDQIINKNLQLTQEQKINFAKNLEAKRRFEKDFEAFKTKPEAEVLDIETGKKVGDIEVEVKTKKVKAKVKKEGKKLEAVLDTPKVDVVLSSNEDKKEFKLDSEKLDVNVVKTEEGTTVTVDAQNPLLKIAGNLISKVWLKKFKK